MHEPVTNMPSNATCLICQLLHETTMSVHMSQALKLEYGIHIAVCTWLMGENRLGMPVDVQASWHDSIVHVQGLFLPK